MGSIPDEKVIQHFLDKINEEATNRSVSQLELLQQLWKQWRAEYQH
jgi:hypothetical protein